MKLYLSTKVSAPLLDIKAGFNEDLFKELAPPFPKVEVQHFGGCATGDHVSLVLKFPLFPQTWASDIIDDGLEENRWYFVDQGVKLPFFLKSWHHHHAVVDHGSHRLLVDDITYSSGLLLFDWLLWPAMYLQFAYRKPIYRRQFGKVKA